MKTEKILLGVLVGIAAGATLGILFAPDNGSNTRKKLSNSGEDFMDDMKERFDVFLKVAKDKLAIAKNEGEDMWDNGKAKAQDFKKDVKNAMS